MIWFKTVLVWRMLEIFVDSVLLQLLIVITRSVVNVCSISKVFFIVSLVTNWVSPEEVCLPSFDVLNCWLNCWLNLVASCLGDENELPLKTPDDTAYK